MVIERLYLIIIYMVIYYHGLILLLDLGVYTDNAVTFSYYSNVICAAANARTNLISRSFRSSYVDMLVKN